MRPIDGEPCENGAPADKPCESLADAVFASQLASLKAEAALSDVLETHWPEAWEDFTTDWYDSSIEVYFAGPLSPPATVEDVAARMFDLGFLRCWVHEHTLAGRGAVLCSCPVRSKRKP